MRVLAAAERVEPGMLEPYAIVTARNVVASMWREQDRHRRNQHRVVDLRPARGAGRGPAGPGGAGGGGRGAEPAVRARAARPCWPTRSPARTPSRWPPSWAAPPGAVAAQLNRTRARLRVEYLLALRATSSRRPTGAAGAAGAVRRRPAPAARGGRRAAPAGVRAVRRAEPAADGARPAARRRGADPDPRRRRRRDRAAGGPRAGGHGWASRATDLTADRHGGLGDRPQHRAVRRQRRGHRSSCWTSPGAGVRIVARDAGPGIADVEQALRDGYSTYDGLGLGLPGARRLMDEFAVVSEVGRGTTVTMTKWRQEGRPMTEDDRDAEDASAGLPGDRPPGRGPAAAAAGRAPARAPHQAAPGVGQPDPATRTCCRR